MSQLNEQLKYQIREHIKNLEHEYNLSQGLILSEDDLKCRLFCKLSTIIQNNFDTMDIGIRASQLHAEIKFYDENHKLLIVPDITILDTKYLSILHSINSKNNSIRFDKLPNKQFEFAGNSIVFELKFCKNKAGINKYNLKTYKDDLCKIKKLQQINWNRSRGQNKIYGFLIIFNKTNLRINNFDMFLEENKNIENIELIYASGNVIFKADKKKCLSRSV